MTCFCTIHSQMYPVGGYCSYCGPPKVGTVTGPDLPPFTGDPPFVWVDKGGHKA